ncbi:TPA: hypothetical protein QDB15_001121 [Burkholderia vietnamiensis]|nr:hypothetical protein [Burkholderia vietnamiensis]MCA8210346.1 hypothetical protein [Burkholderia vietnamiensis]HDR9100041.1 hypothetical protein [Burkholderia vietnamiensis]HDR9117374.1 hypothetical protein [Burkholderia vietnamiensis]
MELIACVVWLTCSAGIGLLWLAGQILMLPGRLVVRIASRLAAALSDD